MNPKNILVFSALFIVIVIALGCTGTNLNTGIDNTTKTTPTTTPATNEFVLTNDNFEIVTVQYTDPAGSNSDYANDISSLNQDCTNYKNGTIPAGEHAWLTNHDFFIMYNIKDVPGKFLRNGVLDTPMPCNLTIDGKTYFRLDSHQLGVIDRSSFDFCEPAVMSTVSQVCIEPGTRAEANFTVAHDITLCCGDICKIKTLPAFCK